MSKNTVIVITISFIMTAGALFLPHVFACAVKNVTGLSPAPCVSDPIKAIVIVSEYPNFSVPSKNINLIFK